MIDNAAANLYNLLPFPLKMANFSGWSAEQKSDRNRNTIGNKKNGQKPVEPEEKAATN